MEEYEPELNEHCVDKQNKEKQICMIQWAKLGLNLIQTLEIWSEIQMSKQMMNECEQQRQSAIDNVRLRRSGDFMDFFWISNHFEYFDCLFLSRARYFGKTFEGRFQTIEEIKNIKATDDYPKKRRELCRLFWEWPGNF